MLLFSLREFHVFYFLLIIGHALEVDALTSESTPLTRFNYPCDSQLFDSTKKFYFPDIQLAKEYIASGFQNFLGPWDDSNSSNVSLNLLSYHDFIFNIEKFNNENWSTLGLTPVASMINRLFEIQRADDLYSYSFAEAPGSTPLNKVKNFINFLLSRDTNKKYLVFVPENETFCHEDSCWKDLLKRIANLILPPSSSQSFPGWTNLEVQTILDHLKNSPQDISRFTFVFGTQTIAQQKSNSLFSRAIDLSDRDLYNTQSDLLTISAFLHFNFIHSDSPRLPINSREFQYLYNKLTSLL